MPSLDVFLNELFHAREPIYDPAKRHQYYLKTRHLKGRRLGRQEPPVQSKSPKKIFGPPKALPRPIQKKSPEQNRKAVEAKVAELQTRLDKLRKVLAELVAQAKLRSGVETKQKTAPSDKPEKLTAKQKKDAAERAKEFRDKNADTPSAQLQALQAKIKSVETKIRQMREELAKAKTRVVKKPSPFERGTRLPRKPVPVGAGKQSN